jgi:hypothetical protein
MDDGKMYTTSYKHFEMGEYKKCYILLKILGDKYKHVKMNDQNAAAILQVYSGYSSVTATLGMPNDYMYKLDTIHKSVTPELRAHIMKIYCMDLLKNKQYLKAKAYMPYLQPVIGPGITPANMSYFQPNDAGKTLLIYSSGGIGDIIMYARFIKRICESQAKNTILFVVDDKLLWLFNESCHSSNLRLVATSVRDRLPLHYDFHTNLTMLLHMLNLTYETLYIDYYLENISGNSIDLTNIINPAKKNVIINWSGNKTNTMERYNRSIELAKLIPLFTPDINWISIQKDVSPEEAAILTQYHIKNCGHFIDNDGHAYKDTVTILKAVTVVITTDTSLVHLAGTMNLPCWCLLTLGCDWRWVYTDNRWYPKVKTFQQKTLANWDNVVNELATALISI